MCCSIKCLYITPRSSCVLRPWQRGLEHGCSCGTDTATWHHPPASLASEDVLFDVGWLDGIFMAWHACMGWGDDLNIFSPLADGHGVLKISIYHDLA